MPVRARKRWRSSASRGLRGIKRPEGGHRVVALAIYGESRQPPAHGRRRDHVPKRRPRRSRRGERGQIRWSRRLPRPRIKRGLHRQVKSSEIRLPLKPKACPDGGDEHQPGWCSSMVAEKLRRTGRSSSLHAGFPQTGQSLSDQDELGIGRLSRAIHQHDGVGIARWHATQTLGCPQPFEVARHGLRQRG